MYTLHASPDTASLVIRIVMAELNLPHQTLLIDREAGQLASPGYRAMHPLGLIPALETPDGPMFETAAMLAYLSERHGLAPAPGTPDRAAFLTWMFFTSTNLHTALLQVFYPDRTAGPANTHAVVEHASARLRTCLTLLNDIAETRPSFLSDSQPTVLGYYIAVLMHWIAADFPSTDYPALHRVLVYLESRPATKAAAADLGPHPFTQG